MTQSCLLSRHFGLCTGILLLAMAVAQFVPAVLDSQAVDESFHLTAGHAFLKSRALNSGEHPPLGQAISALPLLALDLRPPGPPDPEREPYREQDFLYRNRYTPDTLLLLARSSHILITLLLAGVIAWWTRRHFGERVAVAALAMFAFDPNFLAHGHYITTDVPAALGFLSACLAWNAFLKQGNLLRNIVCGISVGLAMSVKYSALLLFPLFLYLYGVRWWQQAADPAPPVYRCCFIHLARSMAIVTLVTLLVVYAMFGFETRPLLAAHVSAIQGPPLFQVPRGLESLLERIPFPAPTFFRGLYILTWHNVSGHRTYLLGQNSTIGSWYYFPLLFAIKTPAGVLLLLLLAIGTACATVFRDGLVAAIRKLQQVRPEWYVLTLPPLFYFGIAIRSNINIGIRHLLPVYPFLFIWIAAVLFRPGRRQFPLAISRAAVVCLALASVESAAAFPRYLAFFNLPSGGRSHGWKYVVDSNLDWGQDIKRLRSYVSQKGIGKVCIGGFGITPPEYYGFPVSPIPSGIRQAQEANCVVAASITLMCEWEQFDRNLGWLSHLTPTATVGDSLWIYDFRRGSTPRPLPYSAYTPSSSPSLPAAR